MIEEKKDSKVGKDKNASTADSTTTTGTLPTTQTTLPDAGSSQSEIHSQEIAGTVSEGQAAHDDHHHHPQSNPPVLRSITTANAGTGEFGFSADDASLDNHSRSSAIHTRAFPRLSAGSGDLYNANELSVVSDDLSDFHPGSAVNTVVAVPARSPGQIREAVQEQMNTRYRRMMEEMVRQQRTGANYYANNCDAADTTHVANIAVAEEIGSIPSDHDGHTDPTSRDDRNKDDEVEEIPRRWIHVAGTLLCLLIVVMIVLFVLVMLPSLSNGGLNNAESNVDSTISPTDNPASPSAFPSSLAPVTSMPTHQPTQSPTTLPTDTPLKTKILNVLLPILGGPPTYMNSTDFEEDSDSIPFRVLDWMANVDKWTSQTFNNDAPIIAQQIVDRYALAYMYESMGGPDWTEQFNFMTDDGVCDWNDGTYTAGIQCRNSENVVDDVNLGENNLVGSFPTIIYHMQPTRIFLFNNDIVGTISTWIGMMHELTEFWLDGTSMGGTIPTEIGNLVNLMSLGLYDANLEGTIPTEVGNMTSLALFWTSNNDLIGTIPSELGRATKLYSINLSGSSLSGAIPTELGELTKMRYLYVDRNSLIGQVPSELGNLSRLQWLFLKDNALTGTLPSEIGQLTALTYLDIHRTYVHGNLDPIMCTGTNNFPKLVDFWSDCIPESFEGSLSRTVCSCCTTCCSGSSCVPQEAQPVECEGRCVACADNVYMPTCEECPTVNGGTVDEATICTRSCLLNETNGVCEDRVVFEVPTVAGMEPPT